MRTLALALGCTVLAAGFAGCIGDDGVFQNLDETSESVNCTERNRVDETEGSLGPGESLTAETNISLSPAKASIELSTEGRGTIDLELTRGGATVWQGSHSNTGNSDFSDQVGDLDAGTYTLTATTETGIYTSADLTLALSYQNCTTST